MMMNSTKIWISILRFAMKMVKSLMGMIVQLELLSKMKTNLAKSVSTRRNTKFVKWTNMLISSLSVKKVLLEKPLATAVLKSSPNKLTTKLKNSLTSCLSMTQSTSNTERPSIWSK